MTTNLQMIGNAALLDLPDKVPIILVLARSLWETVPEELRDPVGLGRLLIVSPVSANHASATARNRWILANCTSLVLGSLEI